VAIPGWYEDPSGDYEYRYWDGRQWTDAVAYRGHQMADPLVDPVMPQHEQVLWQDGRSALTTHRAWVPDRLHGGRVREIGLWSVAGVDVTVNAGQGIAGTGRVVLTVAYPGYTGRSDWVFRGVARPHEVAALAHKWANRCRRAHG
jgi:hypothetical protein